MWSGKAIYGLNHKARCIAAQAGEPGFNRFLVGTLSLQDSNQIHQIEVSEDGTDVTRVALYPHPREIWNLTCSPHNHDLIVTGYNTGNGFKGSLWKIDERTNKIEELEKLGQITGSIKSVLWDPSESDDAHNIAYLDDFNIHIWDLNTAKETNLLETGTNKITSGCWNPYFQQQIIVAAGTDIACYDIREKSKTAFSVEGAHSEIVRDVDINPSIPYYFVSGGDDGKIKFWDTRKASAPLNSFQNHSHWVWNVKYNKFDTLVISSSTDGTVTLWDIGSLSFQNSNRDDAQITRPDGILKTYDDHQDSVYSVAWSCCEEGRDWATFASLSYDGQVVINRVPEDDQTRILTGS